MNATDVLDILDIDESGPKKGIIDKEALLARGDKKKTPKNSTFKRPENIPREVWGLQSTLNTEMPPLIPSSESPKYRQPKAVIGVARVRQWRWTPFKNSARTDGLVLYHWRRANPESDVQPEDYPFARYNKHVTIPDYTSAEYEALLQDPKWTEGKTAHLMELARRFDLRFVHMRDRWDSVQFPGRPSIEDLKERYYGILVALDKARGTNLSKGLRYDAAHERRRKVQLSLLYGRTREQVEEERTLVQELQKIEARRRDRERKKQDLQKLISQADAVIQNQESCDWLGADTAFDSSFSTNPTGGGSSVAGSLTQPNTTGATIGSGAGNSVHRKRGIVPSLSGSTGSATTAGSIYTHGTNADSSASLASLGHGAPTSNSDLALSLNSVTILANSLLTGSFAINFPDPSKNPGVHLRSQKMKLPNNLGQKKIRIIENFLAHLQIDPHPPATAEIVELYNNLCSKILLLYDLRLAQLNCDFELQAARWRLETFAPDQPLPRGLASVTVPVPAGNRPSGISSEMETTGSGLPSSAFAQIDPTILTALRDSDSKRPVLSRYSLGVAGTLAAAAGSAGLTSTTASSADPQSSVSDTQSTTSTASRKSTVPSSPKLAHSPESVPFPSTRSPSIHSQSTLNSPGGVPRGTGACSRNSLLSTSESVQRRRRAAALQQSRVLKKLKIKGHLVD